MERNDDAAWRTDVETRLTGMRSDLDAQARMLLDNTAVTRAIERKLDAHIEASTQQFTAGKERMNAIAKRVEPVAAAIETMESGIQTIGKIGRVGGAIIKWSMRVGLLVVGGWVAVIAFVKTGSFVDAVTAFWRVWSSAP